ETKQDTATETPDENSEEQAEVTAVESVEVEILDQNTADKAGIDGVLLRLRRTDDHANTGPVRLSVDYSKFASAYGADYGARLTIVGLDDCVLETSAPGCTTQRELDSVNDTESQ